MCYPALIPIAIAVGSALLSYSENKKNAQAQEHAQRMNQISMLAQTDEEERQTRQQSADQSSQRAKEATIERARISAIVADSGLGGVSAERIANESRGNEASDMATIGKNLSNTVAQLNVNRQAIRANAQTRIAMIPQPSLIGTGLMIAGSAVDQYNRDQTRNARANATGGPG